MRIAMIGSRGLGSHYGGIERMLDELCPRLTGLGHNVDVFSRPDVEFTDQPGLRALPTSAIGGKHFENLSRSLIALARTVGRYDVIHLHAVGPGILSLPARLLGQVPVVTIHGLDHQREKWGRIPRLCLGLAEQTLVRNARAITVVSEALRRYLLARYDRRTVFIPNGLPKKRPIPPGPVLAAHGLAGQDYVLFASRLTPEKCCHDLIAALPPGLRLVIAGGNGPPDYIAALRAQADPARVHFTGHLTGDALAEVFSNASLFVLPSTIEGMSMALLEALAYGLPVLVSDIPENRAVVGADGAYFPARDVPALRQALTDAWPRSQTRNTQRRHPDWDDIAARYDELYRGLRDA